MHPAVRIWYSPEVVGWLCGGREGDIPLGAIIVKEMHPIDDQALGIDPEADCMVLTADPSTIEPTSFTVMVRSDETHDGWYWANPGSVSNGNPPILDRSAFVREAAVPSGSFDRNSHWYPTGDLFQDQTKPDSKVNDVVSPYSLYGAYCLNCHASAERHQTFSTLNNIVADGLDYRHFDPPSSPTRPCTRPRMPVARISLLQSN